MWYTVVVDQIFCEPPDSRVGWVPGGRRGNSRCITCVVLISAHINCSPFRVEAVHCNWLVTKWLVGLLEEWYYVGGFNAAVGECPAVAIARSALVSGFHAGRSIISLHATIVPALEWSLTLISLANDNWQNQSYYLLCLVSSVSDTGWWALTCDTCATEIPLCAYS